MLILIVGKSLEILIWQFKWSIYEWFFLIQFGLKKSWICRFIFIIFIHMIKIWNSLWNFILFGFLILYLNFLFLFFQFIIIHIHFFRILFFEIFNYYISFNCYISNWTFLIPLIKIIIIFKLPVYSINISQLRKIIESLISIWVNSSFASIFLWLFPFWRKCLRITIHYQ